ncbi:hypothetical protein HMPREF1544_01295 [Mucor circinelloides 1006PhL]|uniref:Uncharacterized protein n=1 Tax=Mucor circinelloides f. circinelloides (strain 1006PhL) TaxID=1220926 RepID=S2JTK1_MUCC1|nr:hypothetical protein HMPREF1544_01295 [Mucor circinelloides 1006PhL]
MPNKDSTAKKDAANEFPKSDDLIMEDHSALRQTLDTIQKENITLKKDNIQITEAINELRHTVDELQKSLSIAKSDLAVYDERHATVLSELNGLKEAIMDSNRMHQDNSNPQPPQIVPPNEARDTTGSSQRSIPAPSKVLLDENKKKDNRLVELRRITREYMNVSDEEAGLRLYKLQKTMIHVVSDLKKYMMSRHEDVTKSWKSIDISTQRVAFEMVEKEASSLGVPLNLCIGYWGARRLISKSWANALRTSKKHVNTGPEVNEDKLEDDQLTATHVTEASPDTDNHNNDNNNINNTTITHENQEDASSPSPDCRVSKRAKTKA